MTSNALLLITQQRQRRKNSKQPQYVRACYTEASATVCVRAYSRRCWQLSRKSKLSTLLSQGILCSAKGPIKKKKKKKPVTGS